MKKILLLTLGLLCLALNGQSDCLDNINTVGTTGFPQLSNECMTLTNSTGQASGAWGLTQVDLTESFTLDFDFTIVGGVDPFGGGFADGFVFVLQSNGSNVIGGQGGQLGYQGIGNSVGLEFDWFTADGLDVGITGSHIALMNNGPSHPTDEVVFYSLSTGNIINNSPANTYSANVLYEWDAVGLTLNVFLDGVLIISYGDITALLPSTDVWAGFVGATGGNSAVQTVCLNDISVSNTELQGVLSGTQYTVDLADAVDATSANNNLATSITNGEGNMQVTYFESLADVQSGTNPIANPAAYSNVLGFVVYALVEDVFGCSEIAEITIAGTCMPQADPGTCNTLCTLGNTEVWDSSICACVVDVVSVLGCTDASALNYDPSANCEDGSCNFATNQQCYVGSVTVGTNGGNEGVCFETTYILVDAAGAVIASNTIGEFSNADGAAYETYYAVYGFTYNMCALGFVAPVIPSTLAALDPTMNCGSLTVPYEVLLKETSTLACATDASAEIRVGFAGWFTGNNQRYILSDANSVTGNILQVNDTGVFSVAGFAEGDYYVCAVNFPPEDAAIVDGSVGQMLSSLEDICRSLSDATSYLTDCTLVSIVSDPAVTISLPTEWCTQVGSFDLDVWAMPAGGVWTDASGATITSFDPSLAGVGSVTLDYTYTDGNNCSGTAQVTLNIGDDCLAAGIPTASEWGLLCLALSLLSLITICVRRREESYSTTPIS